MRCFRAILAALVMMLVITTSTSAHHRSDHSGGPTKTSASESGIGKSDKAEKHDTDEKWQHQGLQIGRLLHSMNDNEADALEDELVDCTTVDTLQDMRLGQIKRLSHAAGLSTQELKDALASDDGSHFGLGRLIRDGLESEAAEELQDDLRDGLQSNDLQKLAVGRLFQAMRACGITPPELAELLRDN
jgi:hypothetical protein